MTGTFPYMAQTAAYYDSAADPSNVRVTPGTPLPTSGGSYFDDIALDLRTGRTLWRQSGYNDDIDTGTELLGAQGGTFTPLAAASSMEILSSDVNDDGSPAGTGARTVRVWGVKSDGTHVTEDVTMNGTTVVALANQYFGINRAVVIASGAGLTNAGNITVRIASGGATHAYIPAGKGRCQQCVLTTGTGYKALIQFIRLNVLKISGGASPRVTLTAWIFNRDYNTKTQESREDLDTGVENTFQQTPVLPFVVPEKCTLWFEITTNTDNTVAAGAFHATLVSP